MKSNSLEWKVSQIEADRFSAVRSRLGVTNRKFCEHAEFSPQSFTQIMKGQRRFPAKLREQLEEFLRKRLKENSKISDGDREELSGVIDAIFRKGAENTPENNAYQSPGRFLPLDAPNYVSRDVDDQIERILSPNSAAKAAYVVGGVGTGKSSLMQRIPPMVRKVGRRVIMGKAVNFFGDRGTWPSERLSKKQIWQACGYALSYEHQDFAEEFDLDPSERRFTREFKRLLQRHLMKNPGAVRGIEDFNELAGRADKVEDVADLLYILYSPSERGDDNLLIITDDGLAGSIEGVSETVTRAAFIECGQVDDLCIQQMIAKILGSHLSEKLIWNTTHAVQEMRDAFGDCLFLHHAALHKIRELPEEMHGIYEKDSVLDKVIPEILDEIETDREPNSVNDPLSHVIQRFAKDISQRLMRAEGENAPGLCTNLSKGKRGPVDYRVTRYLEWNGYVERGGQVPEYVKRICRRHISS